MRWLEENFGLDGVDLAIQAALTGLGIAIVNTVVGGNLAALLTLKVLTVSILVLAWRRHRNLKKRRNADPVGLTSGQMAAERLAEVEERLAHLEAEQVRMVELEERLDFAERLLAAPTNETAHPLARGGTDG